MSLSRRIKDDQVSLAIRDHKTAKPKDVLEGYGITPGSHFADDILRVFYLSHAFYEHEEDKKRRDDKFSLRHKYEGALRPEKRVGSKFALIPYEKILYTMHDWGEDIIKSVTGSSIIRYFTKNLFPKQPQVFYGQHILTDNYTPTWKHIKKQIDKSKPDIVPFDLVKKPSILSTIDKCILLADQDITDERIEKGFDSVNHRLTWFLEMFSDLWNNPDYQRRPNLKLDRLDKEDFDLITSYIKESLTVLEKTKENALDIKKSAYYTILDAYYKIHHMIESEKLRSIPPGLLSENESPLESAVKKTIYEDVYINRMIQYSQDNLQASHKECPLSPIVVKISDAIDNVSELPTSIIRLYTTVRKSRSVSRKALELAAWMKQNRYDPTKVSTGASYLISRLNEMVDQHGKLYKGLAKIETHYSEDEKAYRQILKRLKPHFW